MAPWGPGRPWRGKQQEMRRLTRESLLTPHHPPTDHPPNPGTNHVDGKAKVCTSQTPDPNLGPTLMFQVTFPRILT